jgi:hypothetical protein
LLQKGKHSFLTADRLEKLDSIGFVWSVRGDVGDDPAPKAAEIVAAVKEKESVKEEAKDDDKKEEAKDEETKPETVSV